jgi:hypothetical protein
MRFAIVTPPELDVHVHALDEVAEVMYAGLSELGVSCERSVAEVLPGRVNIVFGAHLLKAATPLPPETILFNLEQIVPGAVWVTETYLERLRRHRVWDYSERNVAALRGLGIEEVAHVPIGHAAVLERIPSGNEDIDVLFYGGANERRMTMLRRIAERGMKVVYLPGVYGKERDGLIARASIVLNAHYYEQARLEVPRCFYLLANARFVVSEESADADETGLASGIAFARYDDLPGACERYWRSAAERAAIARAGQEIMRGRPQSKLLEAALAALRR